VATPAGAISMSPATVTPVLVPAGSWLCQAFCPDFV
jgi:hypothetical protein